VVDTALGTVTLKVAIAPSRNSSNKLAAARLSGSKLLGKYASVVAELPCLRQKTTPSASTLGVVELAPHASAPHKLCRNPTDGSNLLGANAGVAAGLPRLRQKRNYPECNDSGCSRGSSSCEPIQQTGYTPVERIDVVGKNATTVACDHPRSRRKSIRRRFERSRGVRRNTKSIRHKRGRSLRIIHDKESIYVDTARGRSLRVSMKEITTRILWHAASKLT
jgi:hypothetical protein